MNALARYHCVIKRRMQKQARRDWWSHWPQPVPVPVDVDREAVVWSSREPGFGPGSRSNSYYRRGYLS
jgi:hypothetical protein